MCAPIAAAAIPALGRRGERLVGADCEVKMVVDCWVVEVGLDWLRPGGGERLDISFGRRGTALGCGCVCGGVRLPERIVIHGRGGEWVLAGLRAACLLAADVRGQESFVGAPSTSDGSAASQLLRNDVSSSMEGLGMQRGRNGGVVEAQDEGRCARVRWWCSLLPPLARRPGDNAGGGRSAVGAGVTRRCSTGRFGRAT